MVFLQQDAFDPVDISMSTDRQRESFQLVLRLIERDYPFLEKEQIREYFTRQTGLFKNLNYSEWNSEPFQRLMTEIVALEQQALTSPGRVDGSAAQVGG